MSNGNKYYTLMIVPEKTSHVRRVIIPAWVVRTAAVTGAFAFLLGAVMFFDYWSVMGEISENKQLQMENRRLRQQVQVFKNKVATIEGTMDRVKTFATRLKVITNIEDRGGLLQSLNSGKLPDAATNISYAPVSTATVPVHSSPSGTGTPGTSLTDTPINPIQATLSSTPRANASNTPSVAVEPSTVSSPVSAPAVTTASRSESETPEDVMLRREYTQLDNQLTGMNKDSLYVEQMLQDQYELLADQRAFVSALPTRKPVVGYYTSGFGVRHSPIMGDDRVKMHEGVDIANRIGTIVHAPADGIVVFAGIKAGYGNTLIIDHGYGLETWYGHTKKLLVSKGQRIKKGDSIALLGNTGRSTGPHLHYEVRVHGTPIDPLSYILEDT